MAIRSIYFDCNMYIVGNKENGKDAVYLKFRINCDGVDKQIGFTRANFDEKFLEWLNTAKVMMGYARRLPKWARAKPDFNDILDQLKLDEAVHFRYTDEKVTTTRRKRK